MGNTNGAKYKHFLYNVNVSRRKSGEKLKEAIEWYILLLKKEVKAATKWVYKTKQKAELRLKKFGITQAMLNAALEKKGLKNLMK